MKAIVGVFLLVVFTTACQQDDESLPVRMLFGDWVDGDRLHLVLNDDYTYFKWIKTGEGGFTRTYGNWSYENERITFPAIQGISKLCHPYTDCHHSSSFIEMYPNTAQVVLLTSNQLALEYCFQDPYPESYHGKDTTIVYERSR